MAVEIPKEVRDAMAEISAAEISAINVRLGEIGEQVRALAAPNAAIMAQLLAGQQRQTPAERGVNFGRFLRAKAGAAFMTRNGDPISAAAYAARVYGETDMVTRALSTITGTAGADWVPPTFSDELIEFLRPASVVRSLNPLILPLDNGTLSVPKVTAGSTASYGEEGEDTEATQPTGGMLNLARKKLKCIIPISNDLLKFTAGTTNVDMMVRDDAVAAMGQRSDLAFIRGDGTNSAPKGLFCWTPDASKFPATATINLDNVTTDLNKLRLSLLNNNVRMLRGGWIWSPRTQTFLETIREPNGPYAFRDEMMQRGTFWGMPFKATTQVPITEGSPATASEIYLCDFADAVIGEESVMRIDLSSEAAYTEGGTLKSSFGRDVTLMRLIMGHDFGMRHDFSCAILTGVRWGA